MGLYHYLTIALAMFCIGMYGVLTRRNVMAILMGIELMLNSVNINLVAFSKFVLHAKSTMPDKVLFMPEITGQIFSIFVITVAVAEAATGIALVISIYRNRNLINIDNIDLLKW
ncbi:MAG: NADH-quinone oxidoreductase subunit NuoK [Candidatus Riflebacteria bacterium]|nr:NADH-quinone oxidoreductase subunit NuoK [Candidatus Riflebacteria bacterium]